MLPFDEKSHLAHMLDRLTFRVLLFTGSLAAGFMLYRQPIPACIGGIALYVVAFVLGAWLQRERVNKKESEL